MSTLPTIGFEQLASVVGGVGAVTADNFMPRAYALQALNEQNESSPSPATSTAIRQEFCGALYPYAKSGAPITSMIGSMARSRIVSEGKKICT